MLRDGADKDECKLCPLVMGKASSSWNMLPGDKTDAADLGEAGPEGAL